MKRYRSSLVTGAGLLALVSVSALVNASQTGAQNKRRIPGETLTDVRVHTGPNITLAPTPFTASPFAAEFITTGAETPNQGDHYIPSNGNGTFGAKSNIPGLDIVDGTDVADMDGDGDNDFLTAEGNTGNVYLYTNNGAGSFTPALVASGVSTEFSTYLRIADFNRDSRNDFVVGDNRNIRGTKVYVQGAPGSFTVSATLDTSWTNTGNNLFGVAAGDVNGNGDPDILLLGYEGTGAGQVRFYPGDGNGHFASPTLLFNIGTDFSEFGVTSLALFDLEHDNDLDIVVGGGASGRHFVYTNNGTGSFTQPGGSAFTMDTQCGADAFDADGDGDDDLVIAEFNPGTFEYVENLGGTLAAPLTVTTLTGLSVGIGAPPLATGCAGITCPPDIAVAAAATCPLPTGAIVTFNTPVASGDCGTIACSPVSGSTFPVGTTTVTCTALSGPGCSFTVTVFSACLQDDSNPGTVALFNSQTGVYRFCCGGNVFTGTGTVTVKGCTVTIQHNPADRRVIIKFDSGVNAGSASLQSPPGNIRCTITDRNTANNSCVCQ